MGPSPKLHGEDSLLTALAIFVLHSPNLACLTAFARPLTFLTQAALSWYSSDNLFADSAREFTTVEISIEGPFV